MGGWRIITRARWWRVVGHNRYAGVEVATIEYDGANGAATACLAATVGVASLTGGCCMQGRHRRGSYRLGWRAAIVAVASMLMASNALLAVISRNDMLVYARGSQWWLGSLDGWLALRFYPDGEIQGFPIDVRGSHYLGFGRYQMFYPVGSDVTYTVHHWALMALFGIIAAATIMRWRRKRTLVRNGPSVRDSERECGTQ